MGRRPATRWAPWPRPDGSPSHLERDGHAVHRRSDSHRVVHLLRRESRGEDDFLVRARELANLLQRAAILSPSPALGPEVLDAPRRRRRSGSAPAPSETATLAEVQRAHIERTLALTGGRIYGKGGAAERLGLKPSTLQSKMQKLRLERSG